MAIKKAKEATANINIEVTRAHEFKSGDISFDCIVNGINLYSLTYINENPEKHIDKPFISFPSRKGSDGKYYNFCYFKVTDEIQDAIEKGIEAVL